MNKPVVYRIRVKGKLDPSWSEWLGGLEIISSEEGKFPVTVLTGTLPDQPALFGVLDRIQNMNLTLISVVSDEENSKR